MKKQFPKVGGLQSTLYQSKKKKKRLEDCNNVKDQIQVIHSRGDHWIVASSVGSKDGLVCVYDSVYSNIDNATTEVISNLFGTTSTKMIAVQRQRGGVDCGLFAIAMATAIAFGIDPASQEFNQREMRTHLVKCFDEKVMLLFPTLKI